MKILKDVRPLCNTRVMCLWILLVAILSAVGYWIAFSDLWQRFGTRAAELAANKTFITSNSNILHNDLFAKHSLHCDNLLRNMTKGKWIRKAEISENLTRRSELLQEEKRMWEALKTFWYRRGIQTRLWRPDGKCGYNITQERPRNSRWPLVGTWCNKDGSRPCCNNVRKNGRCSAISENNCNCRSCFDMRTVVLAELSMWITEDSRCSWRYYSGDEICDVIAATIYDDITVIGESVTRNMYDALLNLLTEDILYGSLRNDLTPEEHELCVGPERYYWKECRTPPLNISDLYKGLTVCKKYKHVPFKLGVVVTFNPKSKAFLNGVKSRLGKKGSLILFGFGIKIGCDTTTMISQFLKPAAVAVNEYYKRTQTKEKWPKLMVVATPAAGLLKPPKHLRTQGTEKCRKYNTAVKNFCEKNNILFLDVMPFTLNAFSYDGTHHAFAVNAMKAQLFLNYLAQNIH